MINNYKDIIHKHNLKNAWDIILSDIKRHNNVTSYKEISYLSELYEYSLAYNNKDNKKTNGQYYTPLDVSYLLSNMLLDLEGDNICDVCCGTGNLILSYLDLIGKEKATYLLSNHKIYLYDTDGIAINICRFIIELLYGKELTDCLNINVNDFLNDNIILPNDSIVISNPPYGKCDLEDYDDIGKPYDLYIPFFTKILKQSKGSVIISPYSFIHSNNLSKFRIELLKHGGKIFSFDNIPGNIFNGIKHGIFNTNKHNSVRAAITITDNSKGYQISHMIRFNNNQRDEILNKEVLYELLPDRKLSLEPLYKCDKDLIDLYDKFITYKPLDNYLSKEETDYFICFPNTCRYFTTASIKDLQRSGKILLYFNNKKDRDIVYANLNSSFCYWWWRLFDGGITYNKSLLYSLPIVYDEKLLDISFDMQQNEEIKTSINCNKIQENIKTSDEKISIIDNIMMNNMDIHTDIWKIHNNKYE